MDTVTLTASAPDARSRARTGLGTCWCGQELDRTRSAYCPRCGSRNRPGTPVTLSLPAI
jgi:hypothetical protein